MVKIIQENIKKYPNISVDSQWEKRGGTEDNTNGQNKLFSGSNDSQKEAKSGVQFLSHTSLNS